MVTQLVGTITSNGINKQIHDLILFYSSLMDAISYGHQHWAITFSRHDKSLGVYLVWKNPSDGMKVFIDFSITLLNRSHYSDNQTFSAKNIKYTSDAKSM